MENYSNGLVPRNLVLALLLISSKVLDALNYPKYDALETCATSLLQTDVLGEELPSKVLSLDNFRQACLLAYFEFHQYPGERACTRMTQLTRKAYQCGLHQIDKEDSSHFNHGSSNDRELEEWKCVWWCIYRLDSYSNIITATPFVIEDESIMTALVTSSVDGTIDRQTSKQISNAFLSEVEALWKVIAKTKDCSQSFNFNTHIITTSLLREASTARRLYKQNPVERFRSRLLNCKDHVSAVCLALPARFLDPARNALRNELPGAQHARLICILHLHAARLFTCTPRHPNEDLEDWLSQWQSTLEYAEDIVSVIMHWDSQFTSTVDPAVCFIVVQTIILLHLHSIQNSNEDTELKVRLSNYKHVLTLFLQQFAAIWNLPRFLLCKEPIHARRLSLIIGASVL
jgi:hypothetical protein